MCGDAPMQLYGDSAMTPEDKIFPMLNRTPQLWAGDFFFRLIATRNEQRPGFLHLAGGYDDVEVAELPQRNITIEDGSQHWTLIRNCPDLVSIEQIQHLNKLRAKEKIVLGICLKPFPKRAYCVF